MSDEKDDLTKTGQFETLLATPDLAGALQSEQFRRFLDQVPIAIVLSEMKSPEIITYANPEFENISGRLGDDIIGKPWSVLECRSQDASTSIALGAAITEANDFVSTFEINTEGQASEFADAYSNIIEDNDGAPAYRFVALVRVSSHTREQREEFEKRLREKDALLLEIQHRVKNNLQMITALMRIEARNAQGLMDTAPFQRLAGRIESMRILYGLLSDNPPRNRNRPRRLSWRCGLGRTPCPRRRRY